MRSKKKEVFLLVGLIILLFIVNYPFLNSLLENFFVEREKVEVLRVVDGDTIVTSEGNVRLLGINSPEKGEYLYGESKNFLESLILNESVYLEFGKDKTDKYGRILAYVFLNGKNVNMESVKEGYSNYYFPSGKDSYYGRFLNAWDSCIKSKKNLCEISESKCSECIALKNFDYFNQKAIFYNFCDFSCDLENWIISDEGRKRFVFENFVLEPFSEVLVEVGEEENSENILYWKGEDYVWTSSGDTLFLRDNVGKLVLWETY